MKAAVASLLLLGLASAAAFSDSAFLLDDDWLVEEETAMNSEVTYSGENDKVILIKAYFVPPSKSAAFVDKVSELHQHANEIKGFKSCCLVKTKTDNLKYVSVSVWESWEAIHKFKESDAANELLSFLNEQDIIFKGVPVKVISKATS